MSDMAFVYHTSFHGSIGRSNSSCLDPTRPFLLSRRKVESKNSHILAFVGGILPIKAVKQGPLCVRYGFGLLSIFYWFHRTVQFLLSQPHRAPSPPAAQGQSEKWSNCSLCGRYSAYKGGNAGPSVCQGWLWATKHLILVP